MASEKSVQAGEAFVRLYADDTALVKGLKAAREKIGSFISGTSQTLKAFGSTLANYGAGIVKFGTTAAVTVAASLASLGVGLKALFTRNKDKKSGGGSQKSAQDDLVKAIKESFSHIEFDYVKRTGFTSGFSAEQSKNAFMNRADGGNPNNLPVPYGSALSGGGEPTSGASLSESLDAWQNGYTEEMIRFRKTTAESSKEMDNLGKKTDANTKKMSLMKMAAMGVGGSIKGIGLVASSLSHVFRGLGKALNGLFQGAKRVFSEIGNQLSRVGNKIRNVGLTIAGVGSAIVGVFGKASQEFANLGDGLDKMSARTGASTEFLSEMGFVAKMTGSDLSQIESALQGIREKVMSESEDIKMLGIDPRSLRFQPVEKQFETLIDAWDRVTDGERRASLGASIFGASLLPMLQSGTKGITGLREEARKLGVTMDKEQTDSAAKMTESWTRLMAALGRVKTMIGNALAPVLTDLLNRAAPLLAGVGEWIRDNKQLVVTVAKIAAGFIVFGGALVGLGVAGTVLSGIFSGLATICGIIGTAIAGIGSMLGFLLSPIGLVAAAVLGLGTYFLYSTGLMGNAIDWLKDQFGSMFSFATRTFQGICDAIMAGDLGLAFEVAMSAVKLVWLKATNWLLDKWYAVKFGIQDAWANTTYWLSKKFVEATAGIMKAWTVLVGVLKSAWSGYKLWWQETMNDMIGKAMGADDAYIESMNKADRARSKQDMADIAAETAGQLAAIDADKIGTWDVLKSEDQRGKTERAAVHAQARTAMETAEQEARDKWKAATEKAAVKRQEFEDARERDKTARAKLTRGAMPSLAAIPAVGSSSGTFSSYEIGGLGGSISTQQLAVLKEIRDKIDDQQAVVR